MSERTTAAAMRSVGSTLGVLVLAALAFGLGTQSATRGPGRSPGDRVRAALAEPDPIARVTELAPLLRNLEASEVDAVEEAYRSSFVSGGPGDPAIALLCEAWAALDPADALDRTARWPKAGRFAAQKALLRAWARRNPNAAMEWAATVRDDGTAAEAVYAGWAESGDPGMWDYVAQMQPSMERESASIAMMQWLVAREGFAGLLARAEALPDDPRPNSFKRAAIGTATGLVADHDPARALAFADRQAASPYGQGLLRRVAIRWVVRDGPTAMQNLLDRQVSQEREDALREAYIMWLRRKHSAAMTWMPESAARDARFTPLVDLYAVAVANGDPEHRGDAIRRAIRWAEQTADPKKRRETLVLLGVIWLYYEPEAASGWLAETGLGAEVRAEAARRNRIIEGRTGAQG